MKLSALILLSVFVGSAPGAYAQSGGGDANSTEATNLKSMANANSSNPNDCMCKPGVVAGESKSGTGGSTGGDNGKHASDAGSAHD